MKTGLYIKQYSIIIGFSCVMVALVCGEVKAQEDGLLVIGNAQSVPSELKKFQLNSVLKGELQRWKDGTKVVVALMEPETPVGRNTCTRVYNMSGNELQKYFLALVFQGKGRAPTFFDSMRELEEFVAKTPGAIGVVNQASDSSIKMVLIDGKKFI